MVDARIRTANVSTGQTITPESQGIKILPLPFAGIIIHTLPKRADLMAEFTPYPEFPYSPDGQVSGNDIKSRWQLLIGSRGYLSNFLSVDIGAKFSQDDVNVELRWNVVFSLIDLYKVLTYRPTYEYE